MENLDVNWKFSYAAYLSQYINSGKKILRILNLVSMPHCYVKITITRNIPDFIMINNETPMLCGLAPTAKLKIKIETMACINVKVCSWKIIACFLQLLLHTICRSTTECGIK